MTKPLRVYVGWDQRDALSFEVCKASLLDHASIPVEIIALKDWELRAKGVYWRPYNVDERGQMWDARDGKPFSTNFSYSRFCVPLLEDFGSEPVLFCDPDMLWRADIAELLELAGDAPVACVQHDHRPPEREKMTGNLQIVYARKNWSSLMVLRPSACAGLTKYAVNNMPKEWLHGFCWLEDEEQIKGLHEEWNYLVGYNSLDEVANPKIVHFTLGTPDLPAYADSEYSEEWWASLEESKRRQST